MRAFAVLAFMLSLACDGSDISDNPPQSSGNVDASIDGPQNGNDAGGDDAGGDDAQAFCDRYEAACGYDANNNNRFNDEQACLDAYNAFDATQLTCAENALTDAEGGNLNNCGPASGRPPCN